MHTIDLLRGQGIPVKTTLGSAAMVIVMVVVPILAASGMVDRYMQNVTDIEIKQRAIKTEEKTIEQFADAVKFKASLDRQQSAVNAKLSEVSSSLGKHIQWSPILVTLAECMPGDMVISGLRGEIISGRPKASGNVSNRQSKASVTQRKLVLDISGSGQSNYSSLVENYKNRLKSSPALRTKLDDILVGQNRGIARDIYTVSYTMTFMFKSGSL